MANSYYNTREDQSRPLLQRSVDSRGWMEMSIPESSRTAKVTLRVLCVPQRTQRLRFLIASGGWIASHQHMTSLPQRI